MLNDSLKITFVTCGMVGAMLTIAFMSAHCATASDVPPSNIDKPGYHITFDEEFPGDTLDTSKWTDRYPWGRTHDTGSPHELEYYAPDAWRVAHNELILSANEKNVDGIHPYTSGMIQSKGKFSQQYGWFETRCKVAKGFGYNSSVWMLGVKNSPPEIDLFEILGRIPTRVHMTHHWKDEVGARKYHQDNYWGTVDPSSEYHIYAVDWEPDHVSWYVDGVLKATHTEHVPSEPMYLLATLSIGTPWPGIPSAEHPFTPSQMKVSYIRVYQKN